jgi:hypothetical protein
MTWSRLRWATAVLLFVSPRGRAWCVRRATHATWAALVVAARRPGGMAPELALHLHRPEKQARKAGASKATSPSAPEVPLVVEVQLARSKAAVTASTASFPVAICWGGGLPQRTRPGRWERALPAAGQTAAWLPHRHRWRGFPRTPVQRRLCSRSYRALVPANVRLPASCWTLSRKLGLFHRLSPLRMSPSRRNVRSCACVVAMCLSDMRFFIHE